MLQKRSIIWFWILFLLPTLIMAGAAVTLLSHEQERISRSTLYALNEQADAAARSINLTIEAVKDNFIASLMKIPPEQLKSTLLNWEDINPLVRNVFIYQNTRQMLIYPVGGVASTRETRRFLARYDAVFSGRLAFESLGGESLSSRNELLTLSQNAYPAATAKGFAPGDAADNGLTPQSGWLPWFSENRLHPLIWVKSPSGELVYGLEMELMTLLSRVVVDFPVLETPGSALVLIDDLGKPVHQSGDLDVSEGVRSAARVLVSELLPHWQIAVYVDSGALTTARGFFILSVLLVGIFIAAIVSGGVLLTRLTLQNMRHARQKTSFVSSVSHELKTPLTSIRMSAELLLAGRVKDEGKNHRYLSVIVSESERLTRLINNVLDFGKLEQGNKRYRMSAFDMEAFLRGMIEAHRLRIQEYGHEIKTDIRKSPCLVHTDRDAIEQVLLNLLDNALKYAGQGKYIRFVLDRDNADGNKDMVILKICDNGPGIPESMVGRIFEKFYRVDNSLTATQPGSGLGLSIARQVLRDLGGELSYEPEPGGGSCFTARIKDHGKH